MLTAINKLPRFLAEARKAVGTAAGLLASLLALGLLPDRIAVPGAALLAVLATLGVYQVPNRAPGFTFDAELLEEAKTQALPGCGRYDDLDAYVAEHRAED